jgi:chaperonin GroEL
MSSKAKELIFEQEARNKLREGIDIVADTVGVTLGRNGRNVSLQTSYGAPIITNDGNSIVKDIELKDQYANMGISMAKEVASKMKEKCGDGTTSAILLLRALVQNGVKNIASGSSPIDLKRGMEKAVDAIIAAVEKSAIPVKSEKETRDIAMVSASGNQEIGDIISSAFKRVGKAGVITIEEGKTTETTVESVEGMQFDRGYLSSYFCTDTQKMTAELNHPLLLVTDKKISSVQDILSILQAVATSAQELLIIADDIEGEALSTLVINRLRGTLKVCAVKAPGFGDKRKALLQDIAILTGATLVTEDAGVSLKDADSSVLGTAEKILVTKDKTTIINGKGSAEAIQNRIKQIENESKNSTSSYDKEKCDERKAKLSGGVVVIRVGAPTEPEMKQKKQMFEDSLNSTRAALEAGIVPGGGIAILRASEVVDQLELSPAEKLGAQIVKKACHAPLKQIVMNGGRDSFLILEEILSKGANFGFNATTEKVEDLLVAGVVDPAKVVISALQIAASSAGIIWLTEAIIGDAPSDETT